MKIGLMGGWNTDSGASFHSEMIGRSWVKDGHEVTIFTFFRESFHGTQITGSDEDYVIRCFTTSRAETVRLNPVPFLTKRYDVFVIEDLGMLPKDHLGKIFNRIRRRAKTVNIIHDGRLSDDPSFYQFDWDAIVCFDERYMRFLTTAYEPEKIQIIPYPCHERLILDKIVVRKELSLPQDQKIAFTFGPSSYYTLDLIPALFARKDLSLLVVTKFDKSLEEFRRLREKYPIIIRDDAPDLNLLYKYLNASDLLIFNKPSADWVVVSSTVFQCLGSGCPILAYGSNFIETLKDEVFKYKDQEEFIKMLNLILDGGEEFEKRRKAALDYVRRNSAQNVARKYIELFEYLLKRR